MTYLVSIIIPNYNRESLIGETLDSILAQTYYNWECIIVDDGSTDKSLETIDHYTKKDTRFKLFTRPEDYPKGANACRNIGMQKSEGDYIIFFDSDDLMTQNHIKEKLKSVTTGNYDFAITKTKYFNNPENRNPINYRRLFELSITPDHFIQKKINWLTLDPIIKSDIAKSITFTEKNNSAEEYDYFVKLVLATQKGVAKDIVLSLRRYHDDSFQFGKSVSDKQKQINYYYYFWDSYLEIKNHPALSRASKSFILEQCYLILKNNNFRLNFFEFSSEYIRFHKLKSVKKILNLL
jgi:glycosyltransferase involved in cell wall biosynthesis